MGKKAEEILRHLSLEELEDLFEEEEEEEELDEEEDEDPDGSEGSDDSEEDEDSDDEDPEEDPEADEEPGDEEDDSEEDEDSEDSEDDEVVITIGDEAPPQEEEERAQAPEWVRELRKAHRETQRENRELKERLEKVNSPQPEAEPLGPKPTLEGHDYDAEEFEKALADWYERKRKKDQQEADAKREQEQQQKAWQAKLDEYGEAKSALKVKDFDDAEAVVLEVFDQTQQGIMIQGSDNPAHVFYALGKNEGKAKELASIKDPVKFAFAVAKLEKEIKVGKRKGKTPPPPERTVKGTGKKSGTVDSTLERLRAEAEKTGDYTKVHAYRQKKRKAS